MFATEQDPSLFLSMCQISFSCLYSHVVNMYSNDFMLAIDLGFVSECPHIWVILFSGLQSAVLTFYSMEQIIRKSGGRSG